MASDNRGTIRYGGDRLADYTRLGAARGPVDVPFMMLALLLLMIGLVMVLSSSYARAYYDLEGQTGGNPTFYFVKQLGFAVGGVVVMIVCSWVPLKVYRRFSPLVLLVAIALLLFVFLIGRIANGAQRWLKIGSITIQPSEIAKIGIIMFYADWICRVRGDIKSFRRGILPLGAALVVVCVLIATEPHWSALLIIVILALVMLFVGGLPLKWFIGGGVAVGSVMLIAVTMFDYVRNRLSAWLDPFADAAGSGWQVVQSLYAIGSGGLFGLGLGNSRQKYLYLPEEHNDYIFSIVCEELGFIGAMLILALFALLIIRGYWLAMHARGRYGRLVCVGITTLFALQVILNVAVCTNLLPSTGISLPLFSYGGTALLLQMAEIGIILAVSRTIPEKK